MISSFPVVKNWHKLLCFFLSETTPSHRQKNKQLRKEANNNEMLWQVPLSHNNKFFQPPIFFDQLYIPDHCRKKGTAQCSSKVRNQINISTRKRCNENRHSMQSYVPQTFLIQWTIIVPVSGHSSNILQYASIGSHLGRNSSSQKKSLTNSGVASSKTVLLQ